MAPPANYFLKSQSALNNVNLSIDGAQTSNNTVNLELQSDGNTGLASVVLKINITDANEAQSVTQQLKGLLGI